MQALIVIPVFNEERSLDAVLDQVRRVAPAAEILVVDDGSTDRSPEILRARTDLRVVRHPRNLGYGRSLITGFAEAVAGGYDVAVTLDCDEQHEPARIPDFLAAVRDADIVSGSRYLDPTVPGDPPPPDRAQLNREFTAHIRAITGYAITDAWCGFKAYRVEALRRFQLTESSYGLPLQVWVQAAYHRLTVREIPVARIYKNPERRFWGGLDDPPTRRAYYLRVLEAEVARWLPDRLGLLRVAR
ncbi:MAG: glycosyltransferase family 2 protein [Armatimonadota bacterium]|nr:glycosyltransferase family 2 protein [Armatimonadota bacterium]MDR7452347.1 glycosyltransferase family 2 protein [Armatimonadota bacterium]MDR7466907.1 glycosyltransferase family 2 protein [Armatimonadota bacterium]MDR7493551.1 glycosyltransferase family 2 protein [Armatimonadota bacterium]MDR7498816.1 glycosyltransferase family 2 protein [Armatimonadota bacterium]